MGKIRRERGEKKMWREERKRGEVRDCGGREEGGREQFQCLPHSVWESWV